MPSEQYSHIDTALIAPSLTNPRKTFNEAERHLREMRSITPRVKGVTV